MKLPLRRQVNRKALAQQSLFFRERRSEASPLHGTSLPRLLEAAAKPLHQLLSSQTELQPSTLEEADQPLGRGIGERRKLTPFVVVPLIAISGTTATPNLAATMESCVGSCSRTKALGAALPLHNCIVWSRRQFPSLNNDAQKNRLYGNIAAAMSGVPENIVRRQLKHFHQADPGYAAGVAKELGLSFTPDK